MECNLVQLLATNYNVNNVVWCRLALFVNFAALDTWHRLAIYIFYQLSDLWAAHNLLA